MAGARASSPRPEPVRPPGGSDLADALDHLLDPVDVVPLHSRARSRRRARASTARGVGKPTLGRELCHISYWRGYVKSQFVAVAECDGKPVAVSSSPFFRTHSESPPDDEVEARRAHAVLIDELSRHGWTFEARGGKWYEGTFGRRRSA
jgi:hypothetical protein